MLYLERYFGKLFIGDVLNGAVFIKELFVDLYRSGLKLIVKLNVFKVDYSIRITVTKVNTLVPVINIVIRTAVRFNDRQIIRSGVSAERYSHFAVFIQLEICC